MLQIQLVSPNTSLEYHQNSAEVMMYVLCNLTDSVFGMLSVKSPGVISIDYLNEKSYYHILGGIFGIRYEKAAAKVGEVSWKQLFYNMFSFQSDVHVGSYN